MGETLNRVTAALADRYRVIREIGAGGMATVYLAEELRHGREVAIKVLRAEVAGALGADRFLREISVTAKLDHPGILPLLDSGNADGILFYVMPFVRGESLRARLSRERQLPVDDALSIAQAVGDALTYAHARGIVHRDIKPDNILLSGNQARVADFGIARALTEEGGNTLTGTGTVVGSPAYMSPEQAAGDRELDGRSDGYALGCVLYEMLAGQPPFSGPSHESLLRQHLVTPPPEVRQLRPLVSPHVSQALSRAMAKSPADRFQTPTLFTDALRGATSDEKSSHVLSASAKRSLRNSSGIAWFAVLALVIAAIGIYIKRPSSSPVTSRPLIAVLPFRNIGAPEDEYFADGLTEEITSRLSTISSIGIISRSTALSYKGSTKPLREIAKELGVAYLLEGTVRTERMPDGTGQVRVTPELMKADAATPLWTDRMTAGLAPGELFKVQAQIAEQVAGALNLTLLSGERQAVQRVETIDREAHNAYLQGRFSLAKASEQGLNDAVTHFTRAVTADSAYARAWAGLSDAYASMPYFPQARLSRSVAFAKAAEAAARAIALDSTLSEAHVSLGSVLSDGNWRWADAEREYDIALRLDPDNALARVRRSALMSALSRHEEAVAEAERAVQLEPASPSVRHNYASALAMGGRLDDAIASERVALTLNPTYIFSRIWLGEIAAMKGDFGTMGRELGSVPALSEIGRALTVMSTSSASRLSVIQAIGAIKSPNVGLDAARKGWLYAAIGEVDLALAEFESAIRLRYGPSALQFPSVKRALGSSPRYTAMMRTVGLAK